MALSVTVGELAVVSPSHVLGAQVLGRHRRKASLHLRSCGCAHACGRAIPAGCAHVCAHASVRVVGRMAHEEAQPKGHSQQTLVLREVMPARPPVQEGFLNFSQPDVVAHAFITSTWEAEVGSLCEFESS